jgi:hypothetical protein
MSVAIRQSDSDLVRQHAQEKYISVARRRGQSTVIINVGAVHKALGLRNRVPLVCAALGSKKFLKENKLRLVARTGPRSGQSTTVDFTFELGDGGAADTNAVDPWEALRGIGKEVFAALGGGEAFLRRERAEFNEAMEKREQQSRP